MLVELHVRNLGVLPEASVDFSRGLNVITGETGAGKTLLMTSLALLGGARGESRLVSEGATEAFVEAIFAVPEPVRPKLVEWGLEEAEEVVVARRIGADGRSRAWIGGRLAPVSALAEVCSLLIEIHGQGAGFALAKPQRQLEAVDAVAATGGLVGRYRELLGRARDLRRERDRLVSEEHTRERERELLAFQVEEIERAGLRPDEEEELAVEVGRLEHAERLAELGLHALALSGSDGAAGALAEAHKNLEEAARFDPEAGALASRIGSLAAEAAEAAWDLRAWTEGLDPDPARLEALRERVALIGNLKRKYGSGIDEILESHQQAVSRLSEITTDATRTEEIDAALAEVTEELERTAEQLSSDRRRAAALLTDLVAGELPALALPNATFEVCCEATDQDGERGRDRVSFLFSAHSSRPPDLLGKVASGGELSRAMIAVTLALARVHDVPVLVFDEADQGVGGEAALELARRLALLGATHQVLVVSHLPQIAAFGDRHVVVRRAQGKGRQRRAEVGVETLEEGERTAEVSRMLAGLESSELARAHASELIELARNERSTIVDGVARAR